MSSQRPLLPPYGKPWLSYPDQIALLHSRGLVIRDVQAATEFLRHINYYRFSGYCLAFEQSRHSFRLGTTFEQVQAAYDFDRALRDVMTEGLEAMEVDLRTTIGYHFGQGHGAFGHTDPGSFFRVFGHAEWRRKLHEEAWRSSELFVKHFRARYREFPDLPVWVITEIMSFGSLSKMYRGMWKKDKKTIAGKYGLQPNVLESWMHHLTYVRNLCAHHCRLWDRVWSIKPQAAYGHAWQPPHLLGNDRLFVTLLMLNLLLGCCPAIAGFTAVWKSRAEDLINQPPRVPNPADLMGLATNWTAHPLWT